MGYRIGIALVLLGVGISGGVWAVEPSRGSPPNPQDFLKEGKPANFIAPAKAYLNQQPPSAEALQVARDLLMVATLVKDETLIRNTKLRLLAEYPSSVTGQYLLSEMQSDAYVSFLKGEFRQLDLQAEPRLLTLWNRAVETGTQQYGPRFADDELLAQAALAADSPAKGLMLRRSIGHVRNEDAQTLDVAFNSELTNRQKLLQLQPRKKNSGLAKAYLRILYDIRLTANEQADPEMVAIVAEPLLKEQEFEKAATVLAKIRNPKNPQLLYWLAWAQGASGKSKEAIASLTTLLKNHPTSPWTKPAAELLPAMSKLEVNVAEYASATDAVLLTLRESPPSLIEILAQSKLGIKSPYVAYLALNVPKDSVEGILEMDGKVAAAVKASADGNRLFVQGNSTICESKEPFTVPYFEPYLKEKEDGSWLLEYDLSSAPPGRALQANLSNLLNSPVLKKPNARREYFQWLIRKGRFPASVKVVEGERVFRWLTPQYDRPELLVIEVRVTKDNRIASASWGNSFSVRVRCDSRGEQQFSPPRWPELPTEKKNEVSISSVTQLAVYGMAVWKSIGFFNEDDDDDEDDAVEEVAKKESK